MYVALTSSPVNLSARLMCRHDLVTRESVHVGLMGMDVGGDICLSEKLISQHAPLKFEHKIYCLTRGIEPWFLRQTVPVGAHCVTVTCTTEQVTVDRIRTNGICTVVY